MKEVFRNESVLMDVTDPLQDVVTCQPESRNQSVRTGGLCTTAIV